MNNRLHVGNLAFETTIPDLQNLFSQAGTVTESMVVTDAVNGKSRGFGFVTLSSADEAQEAIRRFSGAELHGRTLTVNEAHPRESRSGSGARQLAGR